MLENLVPLSMSCKQRATAEDGKSLYMRDDENEMKKAAAESAVTLVRDGMVVGLGTGSTAAFAVNDLGRRVREGLRIVGIPTSEETAARARAAGIPLSSLAEESEVDLTIDGADEVEEGTLNLVKGHGGALLREKIVASASKRLVIIVDRSKLVNRLATEALCRWKSYGSVGNRPRAGCRVWARSRLYGATATASRSRATAELHP